MHGIRLFRRKTASLFRLQVQAGNNAKAGKRQVGRVGGGGGGPCHEVILADTGITAAEGVSRNLVGWRGGCHSCKLTVPGRPQACPRLRAPRRCQEVLSTPHPLQGRQIALSLVRRPRQACALRKRLLRPAHGKNPKVVCLNVMLLSQFRGQARSRSLKESSSYGAAAAYASQLEVIQLRTEISP